LSYTRIIVNLKTIYNYTLIIKIKIKNQKIKNIL